MQTPILVRVLNALPGPLAVQAVLLYLLMAAPYLAGSALLGEFATVLGRQPSDQDGVVTIALFLIAIFVFTAVVYRLLDNSRTQNTPTPRGPELFSALCVTGIAAAAPALEVYSDGWNPYDISLWTWDTGTHRLLTILIGWHLGRGVFLLMHNALQTSSRILKEEQFDLFDPVPLHAPVRQGLRNALIVSSFAAIMTPFLIDPRYWIMVAVIATATVTMASIGMILPARGVARRIAEAKADELARITPLILAKHEQLKNASGEDAAARISADLTALLDYRQRVSHMREWPFDRSTVSRFGLYLLFPAISWIGAALVERIVDSAF